MPPLPQTTQQRAHRALERLAALGGGSALPRVLTSHEAIACLGRAWFHDLLRGGQLPGVQVVPRGVWRCDRETFVEWLKEVCHDSPTALELAERHAAACAAAAGVALAARRRRPVPRHRRDDAGVGAGGRLPVPNLRGAHLGGARRSRSRTAPQTGGV